MKFNPVSKVVQKLKSIQADPKKICLGYAFGTFMCTTPLIGIKWIVALPVLWLTKWNKVACMIGIFQVNYFTGPLFYACAYLVGKKVCGYHSSFLMPEHLTFSAMKDLILSNSEVFISILTGGMILSIPMTLGAYFLVRLLYAGKLNAQPV